MSKVHTAFSRLTESFPVERVMQPSVQQHCLFFCGGLPNLRGAVGKEHAVHMVDFVLKDARKPAVSLDFYRLPAPVLAFDGNVLETFDLTKQPSTPISVSSEV